MKNFICCLGLFAAMLIFDTSAFAQQAQSAQRLRPQARLLRANFRQFLDLDPNGVTRDDVFALEQNVVLQNERVDLEQCSSEVRIGGVDLGDEGFLPTRISLTTVILDSEILVACR